MMRGKENQQGTSPRYKLYKAKKQWLCAALLTVGAGVVFATATPVSAADGSSEGVGQSLIGDSSVDNGAKVTASEGVSDQTEAQTSPDQEALDSESSDQVASNQDTSGQQAQAQSIAAGDNAEKTGDTPVAQTQRAAAVQASGVQEQDENEVAGAGETKAQSSPVAEGADDAVALPNAEAVDAQPTLTVTPEATEVAAGASVVYDLNLSVSGIDQPTLPQVLTVTLPADFELEQSLTDLAIGGTTPTLESTSHTLTYNFANGINGLSVAKQLSFQTKSGTQNNTTLALKAAFQSGESTPTEVNAAQVTVTSSAKYSLTNDVAGIVKQNTDGTYTIAANQQQPRASYTTTANPSTNEPADTVLYNIGISAPKKNSGQAYFLEDSPITIKYLVPKGMTYVGQLTGTPAPSAVQTDATSGQTILTWSLTAPTYAEQDAATDNLFGNYLQLLLKVDDNVPAQTPLTTQLIAQAQTVNGDTVSLTDAATATVTVANNAHWQGVTPDGSQLYEYLYGPADGVGGVGTSYAVDDAPQVGPDAVLGWKMYISSGLQNVPFMNWNDGSPSISAMALTVNVDPHLNVYQMYNPGAYYSPDADTFDQYASAPQFDLYVKYADSDDFEATPVLTNVAAGNIDLQDVVDNARGVTQLKLVWTNVQPAMSYPSFYFWFTPKAGYYGVVSTDFSLMVQGSGNGQNGLENYDSQVVYDKNGWTIIAQANDGTGMHPLDPPENLPGFDDADKAVWRDTMHPKTAVIVQPTTGVTRVVNQRQGFLDGTNGRANAGANRLLIHVDNEPSSLESITGITSYVTLPKGVTYTGDDAQVTVLSTDYQTDGQTLLRINWAGSGLTPGLADELVLPVEIDSSLNLSSVFTSLTTTVNEADAVGPTSSDPDTPTDVQVLTGNAPDGTTPASSLFYSAGVTPVVSPNGQQLVTNAFAENAEGVTAAGTTPLVKIKPGETGTVGLHFAQSSDQSLQGLRIIGTLPSVGDTAILDQTQTRGSTTALILTGPLTLPAGWENAVVQYSTATDPTAADATLLNADEVTDFSTIKSFLINFGDAASYVPTGDVTASVLVPDDAQTGTMGLISFAVSANGLSAAEGLKAGMLVDHPLLEDALTIHYVDELGDELADPTTEDGYEGDPYTVTPDATLSKDGDTYNYVGLAENSAPLTGQLTTTQQTVTLVYRMVPRESVPTPPSAGRLTVHYIDKASGAALQADLVTIRQTGTAYTIAVPTIAGYHFVGNEGSLMGTFGDPAEVTLAYQKDDVAPVAGQVTVHYVDHATGEALQPDLVLTDTVGKAYSISVPAIAGYHYVGNDGALTGTFGEPAEVTLAYQKDDVAPVAGQVTVHYVDHATGEALQPDLVLTDTVGRAYSISVPSIAGYYYAGRSGSLTGTFGEPADVTLAYQKNDMPPVAGQVTVQYIDQKTGQHLQADLVMTGQTIQAYHITIPAIDGYRFVTRVGELSGFYGEAKMVTLYYEQVAAPVTPGKKPTVPTTPESKPATPKPATPKPTTPKPAQPTKVATPAPITKAPAKQTGAPQKQLPATGEEPGSQAAVAGVVAVLTALLGLGVSGKRRKE